MAFDVIRRYFAYRGYDVTYVQNFTDVDDKIINRANEENMDPKKLAEKYIEAYFEDADRLGVKRADVHPRVTEHMQDIIDMVQTIMDNGLAYEVNGDVYFEVRKFALTASFPVVLLMRCRREPELLWASRNGILWTSPYGKPQNPENLLGIVPGGRAAPVGILNVLPCLQNILAKPLISTVAVRI